METETHIVEVTASVSNLPRNYESTNIISISLHELIVDESPIVTLTGSSHVRLKPRVFTPHHLSQLLRGQQVPEFEYLGQRIALGINHSLASDSSLREPVFVSVHVNFIKERRLFLPPRAHTPSRSASLEVFQRLVEEQRVESMGLEEEKEAQCSICISDLSEGGENIIQMPKCLHMFHQDCLFEWLRRQNSCPLCRRVPFEEGQETETQRLVFRV